MNRLISPIAATIPAATARFTPVIVINRPDAFALIVERGRRRGEVDKFQWFCPKCDNLLHEEEFVVSDYRADPVSQAYKSFFDSEQARTCKACSNVMPRP